MNYLQVLLVAVYWKNMKSDISNTETRSVLKISMTIMLITLSRFKSNFFIWAYTYWRRGRWIDGQIEVQLRYMIKSGVSRWSKQAKQDASLITFICSLLMLTVYWGIIGLLFIDAFGVWNIPFLWGMHGKVQGWGVISIWEHLLPTFFQLLSFRDWNGTSSCVTPILCMSYSINLWTSYVVLLFSFYLPSLYSAYSDQYIYCSSSAHV